MTVEILVVGLLVAGVSSFIGWLIKAKFVQVNEIDARVLVIETKLGVLGDISTTLSALRTDVEVIKVKLESMKGRDVYTPPQ